jgi:CDP-glucose 4,6-dehydratase
MIPEILNLYRGKTVLITGDSGFKGGWLALMLDHLGAKIVGYSLDPPTNPSFFKATGLGDRIQHIEGDIRDRASVMKVVSNYRPSVIFHLAAQPIVRRSYAHPSETMEINIMGTVNVLEAVRANNNVGACICITSDKCYENQEWEFSYRENDALGGKDPYSASKAAAEIVIASYRQSFFSNDEIDCDRKPVIASVRAGNVIGGGDWGMDRLVPDCVRALVEKSPILIRNPGSTRPWQFVLEPLFGYIMLGAKAHNDGSDFGGSWNFGPQLGSNIEVAKMADLIIKTWGHGSWKSAKEGETVAEAKALRLDSSKAHNKLGWKCQYDIKETIRRTISWYKAYYSIHNDMYEFSRRQVVDYFDDI